MVLFSGGRPGKLLSLRGIKGRVGAAGRGCGLIARETFSYLGKDLHGATAVVQGFGKVGQAIAGELAKYGCKIIAVSDISGGTFASSGLDVDRLLKHQKDSLIDFKGGERLTNRELLELPCDMLLPYAVERQITKVNAPRLKAKVIIEGANGPTTPEADHIPLKGDAKLQSVKGFSLLLILNPNIPHGCIKTFVTGEVFYGKWPHSFLV